MGFRVARADCVAVFAVDALPCPEGIENASGAYVLVHDTYEPHSAAEQAHAMGHATATDAG